MLPRSISHPGTVACPFLADMACHSVSVSTSQTSNYWGDHRRSKKNYSSSFSPLGGYFAINCLSLSLSEGASVRLQRGPGSGDCAVYAQQVGMVHGGCGRGAQHGRAPLDLRQSSRCHVSEQIGIHRMFIVCISAARAGACSAL